MKASDAILDHIKARTKQFHDYASMAARSYAESDDPKHKTDFARYLAVENELDTLWHTICQGLHNVEASIPGPGDKVEEK